LEDVLKLKRHHFRAWLSYRIDKKYDSRSTARALSVIRSFFFKYLTKNNYPTNTAFSSILSPRIKAGLPRPLSVEEAKNLIHAIGLQSEEAWIGLRDRALFTLLYACGLRLGEALLLNLKDAPLSSDILIVNGKGDKERMVPVLPIVSQTLRKYIEECPYTLSPHEPLFIGAKGGRLDPAIAQKSFRQYRKMVWLPQNCTPHALRHSFATHLLNNSGSLRAVQELLGHKSINNTLIYTEVAFDRLIDVYNRIHPRAKTQC
jgi:integrase/recombinase XerC